jgi:hypothetical protein
MLAFWVTDAPTVAVPEPPLQLLKELEGGDDAVQPVNV